MGNWVLEEGCARKGLKIGRIHVKKGENGKHSQGICAQFAGSGGGMEVRWLSS